MTDLQTTRDQIHARLEELLARHARIASHLQPTEALAADSEEQAQELENDEVLTQLDDDARAEIVSLQAALRRVEDGSWGTCSSCGQTIPAARLAALPTTTLCVGCAS